MVLVNAILLIAGLIGLVKGSDYFVKSAATIARKFGASEFLIGLTLVAIGTSIPELASSITASFANTSGLILGNIVGSNIANIGLVAGLGATILAIKTKREMVMRDGFILLLVSGIFFIVSYNGIISRGEAGVMLLLYVAYIFFLIDDRPKHAGEFGFSRFVSYFLKFEYLVSIKGKILSGLKPTVDVSKKEKETVKKLSKWLLFKDFLIMAVGGAAIVIGADLLVDNSIYFANLFNIPTTFIGLTIVAIGTSLPELFVTLTALKKGYGSIAIGNIIGSNIANILLIGGVAGVIKPLTVLKETIFVSIPFMIFFSIIFLVFIRSYWTIKRLEGIGLLAMYILFMVSFFVLFV